MSHTKGALRLAGIVILVVLLVSVDLELLVDIVARVSPIPVVVAFVLNVPMLLLKVVRWRALLAGRGIAYPVRRAWNAYLAGLFAGLATPGRLGEMARALALRRDRRVSLPDAFGSVLVDRGFDLLALLAVGALALAGGSLPESTLALAVVLVSLLLLLPVVAAWILRRAAAEARAESWPGRVRHFLGAYPSGPLLYAGGLTALAYGIFFSQCYLLARALGLSVGFAAIAEAAALGSLAALLPITVLGLGTREAAVVAYLATLGVPSETAIAFSILMFFNFYLGGALLGLPAWWGTSAPGRPKTPSREKAGRYDGERTPPREERE